MSEPIKSYELPCSVCTNDDCRRCHGLGLEEKGWEKVEALQAEVERLRTLNGKQALEIGRIQAGANALGRLRAWSTVYRLASLRVSDGLPLLLLEDLEQMPTARVSVWDRPWKHGSPPADDRRYIVLGTQDNPASLAEMVTAALDRWKELYGEDQT